MPLAAHIAQLARRTARSASPAFTLIELVMAMAISTVVMLSAFGLLSSAQSDTTRTTEQVRLDQTARTALEHIMQELHSGCIVPDRDPVQSRLTEPALPGSTESRLSFITITGSSIRTPAVKLVQIKYEPKSAKEPTNYVLREFVHPVTAATNNEEHYGAWTFQAAATPETGITLVEHVIPTGGSHEGTPSKPRIFLYYRYYPSTPENPGAIEPNPMTPELVESSGPNALTAAQAASVTKVTVAFSVEPLHKQKYHMIATSLEDSAVYRLTPASIEAGKPNEPCT